MVTVRFLPRVWLALVFSTLGACASVPTDQASRPEVKPVEITGRFTAKVSAPKPESATGRFYLSHEQVRTVVELSSPFGQTLAKLEQDASKAKAWVSGVGDRDGASMEALSQELLGWPVPFRLLGSWLAALQNPNAKQALTALGAKTTEQGAQITSVSNGEWLLNISDWLEQTSSTSPAKPRLMDLSNPSRGVQMRLIVEN